MTIADTIFDTINDNWGSGGYAGAAPSIDSTESQKSTDVVATDVVEVRHYSLRETGKQVNDVYVDRHYVIDVYISSKTSNAQLKLLYDEVEYLLRNTAMTGLQLEKIDKDWSVAQWERGRHSVILRVSVVAFLSSGAVTSAAGVTDSMQALLMYGSANAAWVSCAIVDRADEFKASTGVLYSNLTGVRYVMAQLLVPTSKGSLHLHVSKTRIVVTKADANDYVDEVASYKVNRTENVVVAADSTDGTNKTSAGNLDHDFTDTDVSGYNCVWVQVKCAVDSATGLGIAAVQMWCYYDT